MIDLNSTKLRWTLFGILFGSLFPIVGTTLQLVLLKTPVTMGNLLLAQQGNPILWIADLAPLVLGGVFNLFGTREFKLRQANENLKTSLHQHQELQNDLEKRVEEKTSQYKAIIEVGRSAASILEPDELISRAVKLITDEFGYYFSAIYLIDSTGRWCELRDATGEAGKALKDSNYRVEIDDANIIGQAFRSRKAIVVLNVGENTKSFNNPLLPYSRSEIALPLTVGERILGVLDVHSTQEEAFSDEYVETLQSMANQVSISLDNARLFQETHQSLREMRAIQKQYLREAWIDSNLPQGSISLAQGEESNQEGVNLVEVPLSLRDQIIGQLSLEGNETLSPDEEIWIRAIATQAALALENARLIEESQSAAVREKFVSEISNKIWASTTINGVLQTAVRELGQVLDATEATIKIDLDGE